jgi:hypothetical protein
MPVVSHPGVLAYRVEVSGWDSAQEFFVEKADLEWSEDAGKQVLLTRAIPRGAIVFLRLLQPTGVDRVHPVAYQADPITETEDGQYRIRLLPARPREREK